MTTRNYRNAQPEPLACQNCAARGTHHCPSCGTTGNALNFEEVALLQGITTSLMEIVDYLESLQYEQGDERPFEEDDLIATINTYASAVAIGDQLLVWVPLENLDDFLYPLLHETLEHDSIQVTVDSNTAMFDLTEICDVYGLDIATIYHETEI